MLTSVSKKIKRWGNVFRKLSCEAVGQLLLTVESSDISENKVVAMRPGFSKLKAVLLLFSCLSLFLYSWFGYDIDPWYMSHENLYCSKSLGSKLANIHTDSREQGETWGFYMDLTSCKLFCLNHGGCSVFSHGIWAKGFRPIFGGYYGEERCQLYSKCVPAHIEGSKVFKKTLNYPTIVLCLNVPIHILAIVGNHFHIRLCIILSGLLLLVESLLLASNILMMTYSSSSALFTSWTPILYSYVIQSMYVALLMKISSGISLKIKLIIKNESKKSARLKELEEIMAQQAFLISHNKTYLFNCGLVFDLFIGCGTLSTFFFVLIKGASWLSFHSSLMRYLNLFNVSMQLLFGVSGNEMLFMSFLALGVYIATRGGLMLWGVEKIKNSLLYFIAHDLETEIVMLGKSIAHDAYQQEKEIITLFDGLNSDSNQERAYYNRIWDNDKFNASVERIPCGKVNDSKSIIFRNGIERDSWLMKTSLKPIIAKSRIRSSGATSKKNEIDFEHRKKQIELYINHQATLALRNCLSQSPLNVEFIKDYLLSHQKYWPRVSLASSIRGIFDSNNEKEKKYDLINKGREHITSTSDDFEKSLKLKNLGNRQNSHCHQSICRGMGKILNLKSRFQ